MKFSFLLVIFSILETCKSLILLESSALLDLSWPISKENLDFDKVYQIETTAADYFKQTNDLLIVQVQATDSLVKNSRQFLSTKVTAIYENNLAYDLDTLLARNMDQFNELFVPILGTDTAESLTASFQPDQPALVLPTTQEEGRIAADKGLVVAVAILSLLLLTISSIVLYTTGGWNACKNGCIQIFFEEVEEEEYPIAKQNTFQVNSYDEESHGSNKFINASETPSRVEYDEEDTQMSANTKPLGITSMRKLKKQDDEDDNKNGLASMLRFKSNQ